MSFAQGVSGLNAAAANLDVIGNNIANSGTVGYKTGAVQFANVYAGSMAGLGTKVGGIFQDFTAGAIQRTTQPLDVAIVDGDGFFRLTNGSGEVRYTRNGQFTVDKEQYIVNSAGMQLTGFPIGAKGSAVALKVEPTYITPVASTLVEAQFNLDARSEVPAATPFSITDSNTYNYSNSVSIYDSYGNTHELSIFFSKSSAGPSSWDVYAAADGKPLDGSGQLIPAVSPATTPPTYTALPGSLATMTFDSSGKLAALSADKLTFTGLDFGNGAAPISLEMALAGSTQFSADNEVRKMSPDGNSAGQLTTLEIDADGFLIGKYSNQQTKELGQIVLSSFASVNGLQNMGDNVWSETAASGAPRTGTPGMGKSLGSLLGGAVEGSNVDLTAELINLIIAQRTYQANTQTVKTQDQVVQALMNLR
jgi:flagellar hook protein FlgE